MKKRVIIMYDSVGEIAIEWHLKDLDGRTHATLKKDGYTALRGIVVKETKRGWTIWTSNLTGSGVTLFLDRGNFNEVQPITP